MADYQHDGYNALVAAALDRATLRGQPMYVYVTASQWIVDPRPPAFDRQHLRCEPDPVLVVGCSRALGAGGYWTETVLWPRELVAVALPGSVGRPALPRPPTGSPSPHASART